MTVTVKKIGGSVGVVIPKEFAREMELTAGTSLQITGTAHEIVMRKQGRRPRRPLRQIVAKIKPASYRRRSGELGSDRPVGKEIW